MGESLDVVNLGNTSTDVEKTATGSSSDVRD